MSRPVVFRVEMELPDGRKFAGAFTVSQLAGEHHVFEDRATYQFEKKLQAMIRVAEGHPKPGDLDPNFPLSLHEVVAP